MFQAVGAELAKLSIEQLKSYIGSSLGNKEAITVEQKEEQIERMEEELRAWENYRPGFYGKLFSSLGGGGVGFAGGYNLRNGKIKLF